ncbi:MAG: rRNA pseudouridine synthase [Bryobacteraceae bacterium]|nr:rRNA pseudouridine synthase [Bryobacteraceae bacterium]MDW8378603.1 pseudouridine synthase [Bryobacterales bacterium]
MALERLQKILSRAGVASRRHAEELILAGAVTVNGAVVTELGSKADFERDHIKVQGKLLRPPKRLLYLVMNKPKGCVTTTHDPQGRKTVMDFLKGVKGRVYPVGRLDYDAEGLLLFTNDGDFANSITRAANKIPKYYLVKVNGQLNAEQETAFRRGIPLYGKKTAPAGLKLVHRAENPWYEVQLIEGRQNQIKLMFRHFGLQVEKLKRVRVGFLELGNLKSGEFRELTPQEVEQFRRLFERAAGKQLRRHATSPGKRKQGEDHDDR